VNTAISAHHLDGALLPSWDWNQLGTVSHHVQFYDDDAFLLNQLSEFVGSALGSGDSAVVLATSAHLDQLNLLLEELGFDPALLRASGRLTTREAETLLPRVTELGWPDPAKFSYEIAPLLSSARRASKRAHPRVAVFGELVAILHANGSSEEAISLEELWNQLLESEPVNLMCAYPMTDFREERHGEVLRRILAAHSDAFPAETYTSLDDPNQRLRAITELQQKALALETEIELRTEVERSLRLREAELADFLENAAEGIQQIGADGRIQWANRAMLTLLGQSPSDFVGKHFVEFFVDELEFNDFWLRLTEHEDVRDVTARLLHADGSIKTVYLHANGSWDVDTLLFARCFISDVTERERMSSALSQRNRDLQSALAARDEFLSVAAHELKTPITGLRGFAQLLVRDFQQHREISSSRLRTALEMIDLETARLNSLVTRLLDTSDARTGQLAVDRRDTDMVALVRRAIARQSQLFAHEFEYDGPEQLIAWVDPGRIEQVVSNLLENAIRFSPSGGKVMVKLERIDCGVVQLMVTDHGVGVPREHRAHLFDLYRQAAAHRHLSGIGVGLFLANEIAALHGGRIDVEDPEGGGARFIVLLPDLTPDFLANSE